LRHKASLERRILDDFSLEFPGLLALRRRCAVDDRTTCALLNDSHQCTSQKVRSLRLWTEMLELLRVATLDTSGDDDADDDANNSACTQRRPRCVVDLGLYRDITVTSAGRIVYLDLSAMELGCGGACVVASFLRSDPPSLQQLRLASNNIGDKGAAVLADALIICKALTKLDLNDNCVCDVGAVALASTLSTGASNLRMLDLVSPCSVYFPFFLALLVNRFPLCYFCSGEMLLETTERWRCVHAWVMPRTFLN
jgi:hypothetical protein